MMQSHDNNAYFNYISDMDIDVCSDFPTQGFVKCYDYNFSLKNECK